MTNMTVEQMTKIVYDAIDDKLGQDISIINIGKVSSLCDYFVIATAGSTRQVKAIADNVQDALFYLSTHTKSGQVANTGRLLNYSDKTKNSNGIQSSGRLVLYIFPFFIKDTLINAPLDIILLYILLYKKNLFFTIDFKFY